MNVKEILTELKKIHAECGEYAFVGIYDTAVQEKIVDLIDIIEANM